MDDTDSKVQVVSSQMHSIETTRDNYISINSRSEWEHRRRCRAILGKEKVTEWRYR